MKTFSIDSKVAEKFGSIKVGYMFIDNIAVIKTPPREKKLARQVEATIRERLQSKNLLEETKILEWTALANKMGISEEDELPANIGLLKSINSGRDIPKINCVVDAANIIAAKFCCPVGVFDANALHSEITLRIATAGENYLPLLGDKNIEVHEGEIVYSDSQGIFSRYCKDADRSKVTEQTTSLFCVVDGTNETPAEYVEQVRNELSDLLKEVCGQSISIVSGLAIANM